MPGNPSSAELAARALGAPADVGAVGDGSVIAVLKRIRDAGGTGGPATIADGADVAQGTTSDAAWVAGAGTVIALLKKIASAGGSAVGFAEEGSLYVAATAVPGTGIVSSPATTNAFAETGGVLSIYNADPAKRIHLFAIEELITAVPVGSTAKHTAHVLDAIGRNPTGAGTQLLGKNASDGTLLDGAAQIFVNPTIVAQGASRRFLGRDIVRTVAPVVNDRYIWHFGRREPVASTFQQATVTAIQEVLNEPAIVIPPGGTYVLNEWSVGRIAAESAEWLVVYAVR